jgi:hypothetical protein
MNFIKKLLKERRDRIEEDVFLKYQLPEYTSEQIKKMPMRQEITQKQYDKLKPEYKDILAKWLVDHGYSENTLPTIGILMHLNYEHDRLYEILAPFNPVHSWNDNHRKDKWSAYVSFAGYCDGKELIDTLWDVAMGTLDIYYLLKLRRENYTKNQ